MLFNNNLTYYLDFFFYKITIVFVKTFLNVEILIVCKFFHSNCK